MDSNKKNKLLIISLIVAFLSPLVFSWWLLNYTNVVTDRSKSNHGDLITPPRQIENLDLIDPLSADKKYQLHGKWSMVYVAEYCDQICIDNLYRMRQIHIAMDKHSLRVQRVLFLKSDSYQDLIDTFKDYSGQRLIKTESLDINNLLDQFRLTEADDPIKAHRLYIIDPLGNLMMSYEPKVDPGGIMKDLKKLLRASRIG